MMRRVRAALARYLSEHSYSEAEEKLGMNRSHIHRILYKQRSVTMDTYEFLMEKLK